LDTGPQVSGVSSEKARTILKPMLREGFSTPDNVQKKRPVFLSCYEICSKMNLHIMGSIYLIISDFGEDCDILPKKPRCKDYVTSNHDI